MKKLKQESITRIYRLLNNEDPNILNLYQDCQEFKYNFKDNDFIEDNTFYVEGIQELESEMFKHFSDKNFSEFEIAKIFWNKTKHLSPFQASDIDMWNYLNHFVFFRFLKKRWPEDSGKNYKNHFIQKSSSQASLIDYTLSGYWWSFYLTVDESRKNPFELTKILFSNQSLRTKGFGSNKIFRHNQAVIGTLEFIIENNLHQSNLEENGNAISRFLTLLGGTKPLAYFNKYWFKDKLNEKFQDDIKEYGRLFNRDSKENKIKIDETNEYSQNDILRYFNLNNDGTYKLTINNSSKYDYVCLIRENSIDGFLLQCYSNGRVNKVDIKTLINKTLDNNYLNGKSIYDLELLDVIDEEKLILLETKVNNDRFVKIYKTENISTHNNLVLMGNEVTKDLQNIKYKILPITLEESLKKLIFKSPRSKPVSIRNTYYNAEWIILDNYL